MVQFGGRFEIRISKKWEKIEKKKIWEEQEDGKKEKKETYEVWEEGELVGQARRLSICKPHYRHYKKEKKDDERENW